MKVALLLLLVSLPALSQDLTAKFKEAESHAPKGYPTLFIVRSASMSPGALGESGGCAMTLETLGQVYQVATSPSWPGKCTAYQPGTAIWGRVHTILGTVVDLLDDIKEGKAKYSRYLVTDVTLVNPETQQ